MVSFHQGSSDLQEPINAKNRPMRPIKVEAPWFFSKAKEERWNDIPSGNLAIEHGDIDSYNG